jgi:site-specific recombinase XerD
MAWSEDNGVRSSTAVQPLHVSAWIEQQTLDHAAPTAKLRLAALRHLFNWLVTGHVIPTNPAGLVRGPSHVVKAGKTPVLAPEEARALIDSIEITTPAGLRDRALIGLMVFSFARIGAALGMKVEDVFTQNRRLRVRLAASRKVAFRVAKELKAAEWLWRALQDERVGSNWLIARRLPGALQALWKCPLSKTRARPFQLAVA